MMMHQDLHPRDDVGCMCQEKKEEEDFEDGLDTSIRRLKDYIE